MGFKTRQPSLAVGLPLMGQPQIFMSLRLGVHSHKRWL